MQVIGQGVFGTVYTSDIDPGCVIKVVELKHDKQYEEAVMLRKMNHHNVIKLLRDCITTSKHIYVFPRFDMNLSTYMETRGSMCPLRSAELSFQILNGVSGLHEKMIMHRDIKPDNVFLNTGTWHLVLGDLGWARTIVPGRKNTFPVCAVHYRPPELILKSTPEYTQTLDVYCAGLVIYELFACRMLFPSKSALQDDQTKFYKGSLGGVSKLAGMSPQEKAMWLRMTKRNPKLRPSAKIAARAFKLTK